MKNIVVIGGGTAGWLTALFARKHYKKATVTLVESKEIGIVGAGEGSSVDFPNFLDFLNINHKEFINNTNGTIKKGIRFDKWSKNVFYQIFRQSHYDYAFHFDSHLVGAYLKSIAKARGVNHLIGDVISLEGEKNIKKVILKQDQQINTDFIFDCTGFAKLVIGRHFKQKWVSSSKFLDANAAITFSLPTSKIVKDNYTNALRTKNGWIWNIPLKDRVGCGYVYSDLKIKDNTIREEILKLYGSKVEIGRKIKFEPGYFDKPWINNSIAIGLSSSFFEPLQATSISVAVAQLMLLTKIDNREEYNRYFRNINYQVESFINFHYSNKSPITKQLQSIVNRIKDKYITTDYLKEVFKLPTEYLFFDREAYNIVDKNLYLDKKTII
jgi:tryptophan halogenase